MIQRRIRVILAEKCFQSWGRAETAIKLIDMDFSVEDACEAAQACGYVERALRYLQQECPWCIEEKPMSQVNCQCKGSSRIVFVPSFHKLQCLSNVTVLGCFVLNKNLSHL